MAEDRRQHLEGYDPLAPANNAGHNPVCGSDGLCSPCIAYASKHQPELFPLTEALIEEADEVDSLYIDYGGGS